MTTLLAMTLFLQGEGPGRGEDPSGAGGVLIIVGIVVLAALIAAAALVLILRLVRSRREADRRSRTARAPLPSEEGRPWSSER